MTSGIHAEVSIRDPSTCQVAPHSEGPGTVTSVRKSPHPDDNDRLVEEFTLTTDERGVKADGGATAVDDSIEQIFTADSEEILRFEREAPQGCVCERIEQLGCPVREVNAVDGTLYVRFVATDHETLQEVLTHLADAYNCLSVNRLLYTDCPSDSEQLRLVDIGILTDRQREVLQRAHQMGYFDYPPEASAAEVADSLDIAPTTFTEHLAAAQQKLLSDLLDR